MATHGMLHNTGAKGTLGWVLDSDKKGLAGSLMSTQSRQDLGSLKVLSRRSTDTEAAWCSGYLPRKAEGLSRPRWICPGVPRRLGMLYLVLRAQSHPLRLAGKSSKGGSFIYASEFSRKELVLQRLLGALLGVEEPPVQFLPGGAGRAAPTSCVMASEDESIRRRFMGDFCCDSTNALYVMSCNS